MRLRAFACTWPKGPCPSHETVINHVSAGKARYAFLLDVRESWPDLTFADIKVRVVGPPLTSEGFRRNAEYRGIPAWRCGNRVRPTRVPTTTGTIVGHNDSANLDVLFETGPYSGMVLNVHPWELERVE